MVKILVTGGAGYIGSVCVKLLVQQNYEVVVIDNLSKGRKELVDKKATFIEGDILDKESLSRIFKKYKFDTIIHFAAAKDAGESMTNLAPYSDNIRGTANILDCMVENNVNKIIFSSTAAVYGEPDKSTIDENTPTIPKNYYGHSKLACENLLKWYSKLKRISYVSLRYFNVAGDGGLEYIDPHAKNIFPIISEVIAGKREKLSIFGNNYNTPDGTCIRDYIHVVDLVNAHIKAITLEKSFILNLGTGKGYSVSELVEAFEENSKTKLPVEYVERREGDPEKIVASYSLAKEVLGWEPEYSLGDMVKSTLKTYRKN